MLIDSGPQQRLDEQQQQLLQTLCRFILDSFNYYKLDEIDMQTIRFFRNAISSAKWKEKTEWQQN